ncbi:MAG: PilZ domain-containing protein [Chitinivibrionales bacterium]|nr:PilZ domain-containing protein [Chitinivibrionales bacterium]
MIDRRKTRRRRIIYYLKVRRVDTGALLGYVVDITSEGFMMISQAHIGEKTLVELRIDLPSEIFGQTSIDVKAQCLWCNPDKEHTFYAVGFMFSGSKNQDTDATIDLITERVISTFF